MKGKEIHVHTFPPALKVNGKFIQMLLEVDTPETVKKRLDEWNINYSSGYVTLEKILTYIDQQNAREVFQSYKPLSKEGERI